MTEPLRIGVAHRGAGLAPVFAALATRRLKLGGLDVQLIDLPGHPAALAALEAGEVDVINSVGIEVLLHNTRHAGTAVVVASAIGRAAVQVFASPTWPADRPLRTARWGVLQRADPDHCAALQVFDMEDWPASDLMLVDLSGPGTRLDRLLQPGGADAVVLHAPEPILALRRGWRRVLDLSLYDAPMQNSCAVMSRATIDHRRALCLVYLEAYMEGVWQLRTDPSFGTRIIAETAPGLDKQAIEGSWLFLAPLMSGTTYPSRAGLRRAAELLGQAGVPIDDYRASLDPSLVSELHDHGILQRVVGHALS